MTDEEYWGHVDTDKKRKEMIGNSSHWKVVWSKEMFQFNSHDLLARVLEFDWYGIDFYQVQVNQALDYMKFTVPEMAEPHWHTAGYYRVSKDKYFGAAVSKADIVNELKQAYMKHQEEKK